MSKLPIIASLASFVSVCAFGELEIYQSIEIIIPAQTNTSYQLQISSNLVDWVDSGYPFIGDGETNRQHFSTIGRSEQYYRVEETTPPNTVEIDLLSYLNPFGVWVYDSYDEGVMPASDRITRVLGTTTKNDIPVILGQEYDEDGYTNDQQFISTDVSGNFCSEIGGHDSGEGDWFWNKPLPILLKYFVPHYTYIYTGFQRDFGELVLTLQMSLEQIAVPAGTFDSVKVISSFEVLPPSPAAGTYIFTTWYVKNIGPIKRLQEDGTIWELKSYNNFTPDLLPSFNDIDTGTWVDAISQPASDDIWVSGIPESVVWNNSTLQGALVSIYVLHDSSSSLTDLNPDPSIVEGKNWLRFASGVTNNGTYTIDPSALQGNGNSYKILVVSDEDYWDMSEGLFSLQP